MNEYEQLINTIDEVIKSGVGSHDYMIGKIEMSIDLFRQSHPEKKTIKQIVAEHFNMHETDLCLNTRHKEIVEPRQIAMYFYKIYTKMSNRSIGIEFKYLRHVFDHSTVNNGITNITNLMSSDKKFKAQIEVIEDEVKRYY